MTESVTLRINLRVYVVLILMTLGAAFLTEVAPLSTLVNPRVLESLLIVIAGFKVALVTEYFMELHYAPKWLRGLMVAWISIVTLVLVGIIVFMQRPV